MSMFFCKRCDELKDSDDGCDETADGRLLCLDCVDEMLDDIDPNPSAPASTPSKDTTK